MMIVADGSSSQIAKNLAGKPRENSYILAIRAYYSNVSGRMDEAGIYFTEKSFPGYYWIFPSGNGKANVGLGMATKLIPKSELPLKKLFYELLEEDLAFKYRLIDAKLEGNIMGWPLKCYDTQIQNTFDRVLLVGDAGGFINPINGEGIQGALVGARWAAQAVVEAFNSNDFSREGLGSYSAIVNRQLKFDMAVSKMITHAISNRSLNSLWLKILKIIVSKARRDSEFSKKAAGVLLGINNSSEMAHPFVLSGLLVQAAQTLGDDALVKMLKGPGGMLEAGLDLGFQVLNFFK